ncbi:hypothetical protein ACEQPO_03055 [Bacillus sp. SL00103]
MDCLSGLKSNLKQAAYSAPDWTVSHTHFTVMRKSPVIRVLPGRHLFFKNHLKAPFSNSLFRSRLNLIATPFEGESKVHFKGKLELISEGSCLWFYSNSSDGRPIILLADRQTTGGYPRIGEVATVDLSLISQTDAWCNCILSRIDHQDAEQALFNEAELKGTGSL